MNASKVAKLVDLHSILVKKAASDPDRPSSEREAREILGISSDALLTAELLNEKFKKAVSEHHPDRVGASEENTKKLRKIVAANEFLKSKVVKPGTQPKNPEELQKINEIISAAYQKASSSSNSIRKELRRQQQELNFFKDNDLYKQKLLEAEDHLGTASEILLIFNMKLIKMMKGEEVDILFEEEHDKKE